MKFKKLVKYLKWIWSATVLVAVVYYLIKNWGIVAQYFKTVPIINLVFSALLLICGKLLLVFLSKNAVFAQGLELSYRKIFNIVSISQLGKYIPGGVWHFVGRFNMYQEQDLSLKKTTKAIISENFWLLSGAVASGGIFGCFSPYAPVLLQKIGINFSTIMIPWCGIFLIFIWFGLLVLFDRVFRMRGNPVKWSSIVYLMILQLLSWSFFGMSFAIIFQNMQADSITMNISFYALSWIVGYVAVFAPGGIGIREAALVWLFANFYPSKDILVYSTVHRFIYLIVEVILGVIAWRVTAREIPVTRELDL